jgi:hypothetical protein
MSKKMHQKCTKHPVAKLFKQKGDSVAISLTIFPFQIKSLFPSSSFSFCPSALYMVSWCRNPHAQCMSSPIVATIPFPKHEPQMFISPNEFL